MFLGDGNESADFCRQPERKQATKTVRRENARDSAGNVCPAADYNFKSGDGITVLISVRRPLNAEERCSIDGGYTVCSVSVRSRSGLGVRAGVPPNATAMRS
jgi:hypothetical protein